MTTRPTPFPFSQPHNWCDSHCHRCPVTDECEVYRRETGRRWAHELRGEDPDDPEVFTKDVVAELESALSMLQEEADRRGVDVDAEPPEERVVSFSYRKLCSAARELMNEAMALRVAEGETPDETTTELFGKVLLINGKIARLDPHAQNLAEGRNSSDIEFDLAPNLMLIELLLDIMADLADELHENSPDMPPPTWARAFDALRTEFAPWTANIPPIARKTMVQLIAADHAPSPFCVLRANHEQSD